METKECDHGGTCICGIAPCTDCGGCHTSDCAFYGPCTGNSNLKPT